MQRLGRANPPDHTSHTVTASGGWKPSGMNTALQKSNLCDEVIGRRHRTPLETHHSVTEQNWLPAGGAGSISLQLSNFSILLSKFYPSFSTKSSIHSTSLLQWDNKLLG